MRRTGSFVFTKEDTTTPVEPRTATMRKSLSFTTLSDLATAHHTLPSPAKLRDHVVITLSAAPRLSCRAPATPRLRPTEGRIDALDNMESLELAPAFLGSALPKPIDLPHAPHAPRLRPTATDFDMRLETFELPMACPPLEPTKASAGGAMRAPRRGLHLPSSLGAGHGHGKHRSGAPLGPILARANSVTEHLSDAEPSV